MILVFIFLLQVKVIIMYEGGKRTFEKTWHLEGVSTQVIKCFINNYI